MREGDLVMLYKNGRRYIDIVDEVSSDGSRVLCRNIGLQDNRTVTNINWLRRGSYVKATGPNASRRETYEILSEPVARLSDPYYFYVSMRKLSNGLVLDKVSIDDIEPSSIPSPLVTHGRDVSHSFKEGQQVKILSSSRYYNSNERSNPKDEVGLIIHVSTNDILVRWRNGYDNSYNSSDLGLVANPSPYDYYTKKNIEVKEEDKEEAYKVIIPKAQYLTVDDDKEVKVKLLHKASLLNVNQDY